MNKKKAFFTFNLSSIRDRPIIWDSLTTTIYGVIGKGGGFLIPFIIGYLFGVSPQMDAFFFAYSLVVFLSTIFSPVIENIIVPFVVELKLKNDDVGGFVGNMMGVTSVFLILLTIVFVFTFRGLSSLLTKLSAGEIEVARLVVLESSPLLLLIVLTSILAGTFNALKLYRVSAISPAIRAIATIIFILLFRHTLGIHSIAYGYVVGEIARLIFLFYLIRHYKLFTINISFVLSKNIISFYSVSSYQLVSMVLLSITPIVNKSMASGLGSGKISMLEYSERLYMIPVTLIASGFIVTLLSRWSEISNYLDANSFFNDIKKAACVIGAIGISLSLTLFFFRAELVDIVYGHGSISRNAINQIVMMYGVYLIGLAPYLVSQVFARALMSSKDTKFLLLIAVVMTSATIILNNLLIKYYDLLGIAITNTIVSIIGCFMAYFMVFIRVKRLLVLSRSEKSPKSCSI